MTQNNEVSDIIYKTKYLQKGESFEEGMDRIAGALSDSHSHFKTLKEILMSQRFLPGGRIQSAIGATRATTPYNCFVSRTIDDSIKGINLALSEAMETMRLGGGIGYDFSTLRPSGSLITTLASTSCGPVGDENNTGFMDLFDAGCSVIRSAGHRRGAQMAVLRVDHPDILHFIRAKRNQNRLTNFNISVAITDDFMRAVAMDELFDLKFKGTVHERISAKNLWHEIMRSNWDWAEPGVLFIDTINKKNNLWFCEDIRATNPCAEQPLPPYGACLLGSFNLTQYLNQNGFDYDKFERDIPIVVRAMDNVVDRAIYPLPQQREEAITKRRMGLGVTGFGNVSDILGYRYGNVGSQHLLSSILKTLRDVSYLSSIDLAKEKGPFPFFNQRVLESGFMETMPTDIKKAIYHNGIRNSHLTSIAPTGTISLAAGNISSGIEPTFSSGKFKRRMYMPDGSTQDFEMQDWAEANYGVKATGANEVTAKEHIEMLNIASYFVDSSVSKTCNVGSEVGYEDFESLYMDAFKGGASGCTTFRMDGKRFGILQTTGSDTEENEGAACYIDPETGTKTCE